MGDPSLKVVDPGQARKGQLEGQNRLTKRVPVPGEWGEVFGDPVVASAILDRLMRNAIVFNIKGPSWRMREHHALQTATSSNPR